MSADGSIEIELKLDQKDYDKGLKDAQKETKSFADKIKESTSNAGDGFTVLKGVIANLVSQGINLAISAAKKLGETFVGVVKGAVEAYASYEQLVGGVQTLFGAGGRSLEEYAKSVGTSVDKAKTKFNQLEKAQQMVVDSASKAYKTAGLSSNQYMETVTSFSAALISSLGGDTVKAANLADKAIIAMADNANKMGTPMESIQAAWQGFAKQNYTMLDNLKLGYGGTKSEMLRLIKDSGVLGAETEKLTMKNFDEMVSFDKIVEAIIAVQDQMDISGTTAKEASTTIEGSVNSMKAAWENWLTGLGAGEDMTDLTNQLIDTIETVATNLIPVIERVVGTIFDNIKQKFPDMINYIFEEIKKFTPDSIDSVLQKVQDMFNFIVEHKDEVIAGIEGVVTGFLAFKTLTFLSSIIGIISTFFSALAAGEGILGALGAAFGIAFSPVTIIIGIIAALAAAFIYFWNTSDAFREFWINLWNTIVEAITAAYEWVSQTISDIGTFLSELGPKAIQAGSDFINGIVTFFSQLPSNISQWFTQTVSNAAQFVTNFASKAKEAGSKFMSDLVQKVSEIPGKLISVGSDIVNGIWNGISSAWSGLVSKVKGLCSNLVNSFKSALQIGSPSKVFKRWSRWIPIGAGEGIKQGAKEAIKDIKNFSGDLFDAFKGEDISGRLALENDLGPYGNGFYGANTTYTVNQTINSAKELTPSEIAEDTSNAIRRLEWQS